MFAAEKQQFKTVYVHARGLGKRKPIFLEAINKRTARPFISGVIIISLER